MPVNPAAGSPIRAVKKLLGGAKEEPVDKPHKAPAKKTTAKKAPSTTTTPERKTAAKKSATAKTPAKKATTPSRSPAKTEATVTKTASSTTAKKTAAKKAPAKKAAPKKGVEPQEESKIPVGIDLADALEVPPVADGTVMVDAQGKKILPDIPDEEFEKDLATDPTLK